MNSHEEIMSVAHSSAVLDSRLRISFMFSVLQERNKEFQLISLMTHLQGVDYS